MKKNLYGIEAEITKKRVKNVSIRVNETGDVFLTVPYGISEEKACEFFKSKIEWIKRAVEKTENYRKTDFSDGGELFVFGQKRRLEVVKGSREQVICGDDIMTVVVKNEERSKAATIKYLEKEEIVSIFEDEIVEMNDQCLSNYLEHYVFFNKRLIRGEKEWKKILKEKN